MKSPKKIGDTAVARVLASLLKKEGTAILLPFGDSQRYDLVLERSGKFIRIQCKNGRVRNGCVRFSSSSTEWYKGFRRKNYKGQADYFGVYCPELDKTYLVPVASAGVSQVKLRLDPTKNRQSKYVRWASEYEI